MKPEELIDAIGMIKDEYVDEAAPQAKITRLPEAAADENDEKKWRATSRRRSGWLRYGSVVAAAALLVAVFGITQLAVPRDSGSKADSGASEPSAVASDSSANEADDAGAQNAEGIDDMINPMQETDKAAMAQKDGVNVTLPEGASEARWFRYEMEPVVDEVRFVYEGREVNFRAQAVDPQTAYPMDVEAFTGLYYDWDSGVKAVYDNDRGGFYTAVDASKNAEVLYWYSDDGRYIFSLSVSGEALDDVDACTDSLVRIYNDIDVAV